MFHLILYLTIAISLGQSSTSHRTVQVGSAVVEDPNVEGTVDAVKEDWQPEPQVASGKFTTALEVKPILTATKGSWVALREYEGKDLLYFTQLLAWRCGLHEIHYSINGEAEHLWNTEECHLDTAQPNAIKMETQLPYTGFELGSVNSVTIRLIYDDAT